MMNILDKKDPELFYFIHPTENDSFTTMSGKDLQRMIVLLEDYYLPLRDELGLDQNTTFGLELEFEHAQKNAIERSLEASFPDLRWAIVVDNSLDHGAEINSPILTDTKRNWQELKEVCEILRHYAEISQSAAGHIHVGSQILGSERYHWRHFFRLWSAYENIIYRFSYGDHLTARPSMQRYARPISLELDEQYELFENYDSSLFMMMWGLSRDRYQAVNFQNVRTTFPERVENRNTIEFRCPNGTLSASIWQNNVNLFTKLLNYAANDNYNEDMVENRKKQNEKALMNLDWYDEIYLDQALEFTDLIFTNNLDKINFLKQYLKSLEVRNRKERYPKAPILTKK